LQCGMIGMRQLVLRRRNRRNLSVRLSDRWSVFFSMPSDSVCTVDTGCGSLWNPSIPASRMSSRIHNFFNLLSLILQSADY
jgi:hypothetical protein